MRKIVAGNWKMNMNYKESIQLMDDLIQAKNELSDVEMIVAPPSIYLSEFSLCPDLSPIKLAAQNVHFQNNGAFTGEISASMLSSLGLEYCIVGHSERRQYFGEDNIQVAKKAKALLDHGLVPIICVGEHLQERYEGKHFEVVATQLKEGLKLLNMEQVAKVILAYEPVWAIGTGQTASCEQAQEMHEFIRTELANKIGFAVAANIPILYGGSCNAANAKELFAQPDINGGLIGGASLKPTDFLTIANSFQ